MNWVWVLVKKMVNASSHIQTQYKTYITWLCSGETFFRYRSWEEQNKASKFLLCVNPEPHSTINTRRFNMLSVAHRQKPIQHLWAQLQKIVGNIPTRTENHFRGFFFLMLCVLCVSACFLAAQCHKTCRWRWVEMSSVSISRLCKKKCVTCVIQHRSTSTSIWSKSLQPTKKEKIIIK